MVCGEEVALELASRLRNGNAPITKREKARRAASGQVYALDAYLVLSRPRFLPASRLR